MIRKQVAPRENFSSTAALRTGRAKQGDDRRILYGTFDGRLICLDAKTGKPCQGFGTNGAVDLRAGVADEFPTAEYAVTSAPAIYKDLVITGAAVPEYPSKGPSGAVRAFDVRTGKLVWTFHTIPGPGEAGHETWTERCVEGKNGRECVVHHECGRGARFGLFADWFTFV